MPPPYVPFREWILTTNFWDHPPSLVVARTIAALSIGAGSAAVVLFFVISGFVLSLSLSRSDRVSVEIGCLFVLKRVLRLYPAYFLALVAWLIASVFVGVNPITILRVGNLGETLSNFLLFSTTMNVSAWSLRVELAATPLIFVLWIVSARCGRYALPLATVLLMAASFLFLDAIGRHLFCFAFGFLIQEWGSWITNRLRKFMGPALVLIPIALLVSRPLLTVPLELDQVSVLIETVASTILIALVVYGRPNLLSYKPLIRLGEISYSFYLYNLMLLELLIVCAAASPSLASAPLLTSSLVALGSVGLTIPLAIISYKFVEQMRLIQPVSALIFKGFVFRKSSQPGNPRLLRRPALASPIVGSAD
jgi:peptidoglycan/LPS O-acetylase OafA/YrhL